MLRNSVCLVIAHMVDATQLVIAHMVDATQLCLSCNCTHGGCYATVLVLSLHTWWMLRNSLCLVIAHMVDATQLSLSCHCTHGGCYATHFVLSLHTWWMLRNCACLVIAHMVDATQLTLSLSGALQNAILQASACPPSSKADRYAVPRSDMETIEKIHTERASQPRPNHQT